MDFERGAPPFRFLFFSHFGKGYSKEEPMITISNIGQNTATEGQKNTPSPRTNKAETKAAVPVSPVNEEMKDSVAQISQETQKVKAQIEQIQSLTNNLGTKLQFNVNEQLGKVVVKVVDPSTDKVIKEIPSEEIQTMQIRIKEAIGLIFDQQI